MHFTQLLTLGNENNGIGAEGGGVEAGSIVCSLLKLKYTKSYLILALTVQNVDVASADFTDEK